MTIELKSKISLSNFNPKQIHAQPETVRELTLGSIMGIASGIKVAMAADGVTQVEGLKGNFEINYLDGSRIGSGICYLPEAFMQPLLDLLSDEVDENGEVIKPAAKAVNFAFVVKVVRAENAAGYSWAVTPVGEAVENDPLAALRASLASPDATKLLGKPAVIDGTGKAPAKKAD